MLLTLENLVILIKNHAEFEGHKDNQDSNEVEDPSFARSVYRTSYNP